jgi:hypothetical protein
MTFDCMRETATVWSYERLPAMSIAFSDMTSNGRRIQFSET